MVAVNLLKALGEDAVMDVTVEGMQEGAHAHDHGDEHDEEHADHDDHNHEGEPPEEHAAHADEHDDHDHEGETPEEHAAHADEHDDHDHDDHDDHDHAGHAHNHEDEHIWLSLRNAQKLSRVMAMELAFLDPDNAAQYLNNQKAYAEKLAALDAMYQQAVDAAPNKTLLFGDRFPFRYLVEDYGLAYYAAFSGCSAETEASFETVAFLAKKTDELKLPAVLSLDGSDGKLAQAVLNASADANRSVLVLDAMQTVNAQMVEEGTTYLGIMEKNLDVLKEALK
jgi:zinc transport system substrate-binding protein